MKRIHTPVLYQQVIDLLVTDKSGVYFDGTLGFGGHTEGILKSLSDSAVLIGTDVDKEAFGFSKKKFSEDKRVKLYNFNFSQIDVISKIESISFFTGVFADLGVSSFQLDNPGSGFTYRVNTNLDLRMDKSLAVSAAEIVNSFSEEDLAGILYNYGEEKNSRKIARKIVQSRQNKKILSTGELAELIIGITPERFHKKTLSRVFQALRIYVNDELNLLKIFLEKSVGLIKPGGRLAVITYHSLEDRIVKDHFRFEALDCICPKSYPVCKCEKQQRLKPVTRKPVVPDEDEVLNNRRARSAKLRVAERI